jgi:hypothetical protein
MESSNQESAPIKKTRAPRVKKVKEVKNSTPEESKGGVLESQQAQQVTVAEGVK